MAELDVASVAPFRIDHRLPTYRALVVVFLRRVFNLGHLRGGLPFPLTIFVVHVAGVSEADLLPDFAHSRLI